MYFKNILCVILVLMLAFSAISCTNTEDKDTVPKTTRTQTEPAIDSSALAREAARNFLGAFCSMDVDKMSEYVLLPDAPRQAFPYASLKEYAREITYKDISAEKLETMSAIIGPAIDAFADAVIARTTYEIAGFEEKDGSYDFEVGFSTVNPHEAFEILGEVVSEDSMNRIAGVVANELAESGTITAETSQEETTQVLIETVGAKMVELVESRIARISPVEETAEIHVVQNEEKWVVDTGSNDLFERFYKMND